MFYLNTNVRENSFKINVSEGDISQKIYQHPDVSQMKIAANDNAAFFHASV